MLRKLFDILSSPLVVLMLPFVVVRCPARAEEPAPATTQTSAAPAGLATPLFALDPARFNIASLQDSDKHPVKAGTIEAAEGKFGPALKLSFTATQSGAFMMTRPHPTAAWDAAEGFSFWVKGDGSSSFGGIELIDSDDFSLRYGYCFPIESTEWRQIFVRWSDLIPELAAPLIGTGPDRYPPSRFGNFAFGKWFYWRDYPAHSYTIDRVVLEPTLPAKTASDTEPTSRPEDARSDPLARVRARLARHEPITVVTMGDSLSDKHHWSNHETLWSELLVKKLHADFGSDVRLVNPSIGGTTLSQNTILIPRWLAQAPAPDLVIIWFGGNDWDSNVRGPRFGEYLRVAIDRVRKLTHDSADVLVMTTEPNFARWDTYAHLEQAEKEVASQTHAGLLDIAAEFRKAGSADEAMKRNYWAWDKVHLGPAGHTLVAQSVEATLAKDN